MSRKRRAAKHLRHSAHAVLTFGWLGMVPIAWYAGWLESLVFISACSIYANFASHLAAWLADDTKQLDRIEALLIDLRDQRSS